MEKRERKLALLRGYKFVRHFTCDILFVVHNSLGKLGLQPRVIDKETKDRDAEPKLELR